MKAIVENISQPPEQVKPALRLIIDVTLQEAQVLYQLGNLSYFIAKIIQEHVPAIRLEEASHVLFDFYDKLRFVEGVKRGY